MAKFDFDKPVASFSWYLQNGSADDKRGNCLHVGTGQKAQIYFDPESGEFIGKLKYVDDYIDLADGAKQHFELPRTAREYKGRKGHSVPDALPIKTAHPPADK